MKLLLDENLSPKLVERLKDIFPGSAHVDHIGLGNVNDLDVWKYAGQNDYILVSKDADFHETTLLKGHPPKLIWIRRGNCSVRDIELILRKHIGDIQTLADSDELGYLMLF